MSDEERGLVKDLLLALHDKMGQVQEDIATIRTDQASIKDDLKEHIRRTDILEETVLKLKGWQISVKSWIKGSGWLVGLLVSAALLALEFIKKS